MRHHQRVRVAALFTAMVVVASTLVVGPAPLAAAAPPPEVGAALAGLPANCTPNDPAYDRITCVFGYTGTVQQWKVPVGVRKIWVEVAGAQGGNGTNNDQGTPGQGGPGGVVTAEVSVTDAQVYDIIVGGQGGRGHGGGGWPDGGHGGSGGSQDRTGCGGGGRSAVNPADGTWTIMAAGGGGCGGKVAGNYGVDGGAGGIPAQGGPDVAWEQGSVACSAKGRPGGGATAQGPGGPGSMGEYLSGFSCKPGDTPTLSGTGTGYWLGRSGGQGGDAQGSRAGGGGGGGGGYYGGGGGGGGNDGAGGYGGGGGGGGGRGIVWDTPLITNAVAGQGGRYGSGQVTISYKIDWQGASVNSLVPVTGSVFYAGSPVTGTFALYATGNSVNHPSGDMTVTVGDDFGCRLPDSSGSGVGRVGSCTFTPLHAGWIPVTVTYAGNGGVEASSATRYITVEKMPTTTTLTPSTDGGTLTATVTGSGTGVAFDGKIDITADGTALPLCTGLAVTDNADGTATASCDITRTVGTSTDYVATYQAGADTAGSVSAVFTDTVDRAVTTTAVTFDTATLSYGETASATVTVTPSHGVAATFDGTVDVTASDGGTPVTVCVAVPIRADGTAPCAWQPGAGTWSVDATYSGGTQLLPSANTTPATLSVATIDPTVVLTADPAGGATAGQTVTLHAAVTAVGGPVDGARATFTDEGTTIPGCADVTVVAGAAECMTIPVVGDHTFRVTTAPTANLDAVTVGLSGASAIYPVGRRSSTTTVAMTTLGGSPTLVAAGTAVTATATVDAGGASVGGTVAFSDNGQPITGCDTRPVTGGIATCTWTPTAGIAHQVNAAYAGDTSTAPSATATPIAFSVGRHTPAVVLDVTATGSMVTLTAEVTSTGPTPGGTVTFTDGGTTVVACGTVAAPHATCTYRASGGAHTYRAVYSGDTPTAAATSSAHDLTLPATPTAVTATVRRVASGTLAVTATVTAPGEPTATPTGTIAVTAGTGTCTATLTPVSGGGATATCTVATDTNGTVPVTATYTPDDATHFNASTGTISYDPARTCTPGVAALVGNLTGTGPWTVSAGDLGEITLDVDGTVVPCDGDAAFTATVDADLFGGTLRARDLAASINPDGFCIESGTFSLPDAWDAPTITVSTPICFSLAVDGTIDGITSGGLTGTFPADTFLFVDLPGMPETSLSIDFPTLDELHIGVLAGPGDEPVAALGVTVTAEGTFTGTLTTPGLELFGRSLADLSVTVSGGGGQPVHYSGSLTLTDIDLATGLRLSTATVTVADTGFSVEGTAAIGVSGQTLELGFAGSLIDRSNWSLALTSTGGPAWEPIGGLSLRPDFSGSITSTDGAITWSVTAGDGAFATWNPAPGATVVVDTVTLSSDDGLLLSFAGSLDLSGVTVAVEGSVDLTVGTFHFDGDLDAIDVAAGMTLDAGHLSVDGAVSGAFSVTGGATARVTAGTSTHTLAVTFAFGSDGTLVIGGVVDLTSWGAPVRGYVAYASSRVTGFDTHDATVGDAGRIDLAAGLTAAAVWTPSAATAQVLDRLGFTLGAGSTVELAASLAPGRAVTFHAALAAPDDVDFLTLPGGVAVTGASVDFADGTLAVVIDARVVMGGGADDATLHVTGTVGDGTFTGAATLDGLVVFDQRIDLAGTLTIIRTGTATTVAASITGTIPGPIDLPGATLRAITLTLDDEGLSVTGTVDIAGRIGIQLSGTIASVTRWSLAISAATSTWTPAPGLTVTARIDGTISRNASGVTFDLTATGNGGDLARFAPVDGFAVAVRSIRVANTAAVPNGCSIARSGDVWLYVNGSATLMIGSASGTATAAGCFDLTAGTTKLTADASSMRLSLIGGKVVISGPVVAVTRTSAGYAVDASVLFQVAFPGGTTFSQTATLSLRSGGVFIVGVRTNLSQWLGSAGGSAYLYYASAAVKKFDTGDPSFGTVDLTAGITFAVKLALPTNVAEQLGSMGLASPGGATVTAVGTADFSKSTYTLQVLFDAGVGGQKLFTTGSGVSLTLDRGYVKLTVSGGSVSFGLGLDTTLHTPSADRSGPGSDVTLRGEITVSTTELKVALSLGDCDSGVGWQDAFGVDGLTVQCAAVQGGFALAGPPLPTFGMMGTITSLPRNVADAIGFVNGAPISFAFNLDPFLLSISVGSLDSDRVASRPLAMYGAPDAMAVTYAALYISPTGAKIGDQTYPAGIGFAFQASIAGVSTSVLAQIDLSVPRVVFDGRLAAITVGPVTLGPVAVHFEVSPRTFAFTFDGGVAIGPVEVDLGAVRIGGRLAASVHLGVAPKRVDAWIEGQVSAWVSGYLPHAVCYYSGVAPYPCDWWWDAAGYDFTLPRTGFVLDDRGLLVTFAGYELTLPFDGSRPAVGAT